ncbi:MAG: cytochrome b N-terminal domain-containing protein [Geobacteraceae bacterium]
MLNRLANWINERWPLSELIRLGLEEDIPGGSSYAYVFGSLLLFTFSLQAVTGIWQLFYYVPSVQYAYDSLNYLRTDIPFGWLIHGLHYWGANAMIILLLCHAIRVFAWGAYKPPRELTWLAGIGLFLITLAMSFTGAPLPWDEQGFWATEVGTSIAGTVPFVGNLVKQLMRGGQEMGQLALSRMFILHVAIFPIALLGLAGFHLVAFRKFGGSGPWEEAKQARSGRFWPDQVFKDTVACAMLLVILIALVVIVPPPFAGPADPLDTTYIPKPEWNFLFLYQILKFFPGKFEAIGTVGIPTLGILVLALLPFFDKKSERAPGRRLFAMSIAGVSILGLIGLTLAGHYSNPAGEQGVAASPVVAQSEQSSNIGFGKALFQSQGCTACHMVSGSGGNVGPDLSGEGEKGRSREWIRAQIRNSKTHDPQSLMPAYMSLTDKQVDQLVEYLLSLTGATPAISTGATPLALPEVSASSTQVPGKAAFIIGSAEHGTVLFEKNCAACHGPRGADKVPNPGSADGFVPLLQPIDRALYNKNPQLFASAIDLIIQHGSRPEGPRPALIMPAFGDTRAMTQQEIADLEAFILDLNGVNRGEIVHPGMQPGKFLLIVSGLFLFLLIFVFYRMKISKDT